MFIMKFLFLTLCKGVPIIKHLNVPTCVNCLHYIEYVQNSPTVNYDTLYAKCRNFGKKNLVSGKINYEYASISRHSENMCGEKGKYYEENPDKK